MKLLIIGSKGFIGSHALNYFSSQPSFEVWGCDVVTDYEAQHYFLIDVSHADYDAVFQEQAFDVCINCSGAASVPDSMVHPLRDYYLNTKSVFSLLEAIRKFSPGCKFINLSSAAVYGNPAKLPVQEQDPIQPLSPYGWHKYQSELICKEFYQNFNMATCAIRIFSAFGPGLSKQLFWDWHQKTLHSSSIAIFGTGKESRDFIYISDLVHAIEMVILHGAFTGEVYNVANGEEVSIQQAIEVFKSASRRQFDYTFTMETRKGDPLNWVADIQKLRALGYKQQVNFEKGIEYYCQWLRKKK
jgi:dTDP-glucose 4,6-dehydratase/UDP-glucose 4-epimerase